MRSCCIAQGTIPQRLWRNMMENNERRRECIYTWLGPFAVQQKLAEHCKSTIIKKFNKIFKKERKEWFSKATTHHQRHSPTQSPKEAAQKAREQVGVGVGSSGRAVAQCCCPRHTGIDQPRPASGDLDSWSRGSASAPIPCAVFLFTTIFPMRLWVPECRVHVYLAHHSVHHPWSTCDPRNDGTNETRVENKILFKTCHHILS